MNTEVTHNQKKEQTTGSRLRNAREKLRLSQQTVAERLCLKVSMVRDIEEDNMPDDLASIFFRGYIRSYARLVALPEEELLPTLTKQISTLSVKTVKTAPNRNIFLGNNNKYKKNDNWLTTLVCLTLALFIAPTGAWWLQSYETQKREITEMSDQYSSKNLNSGGRSESKSLGESQRDTSRSNVIPERNKDIQSSQLKGDSLSLSDTDASAKQKKLTGPSYTHNVVVAMDFNDDCWLRVSNRNEKLLSGTQYEDTSLNLDGRIPHVIKISTPVAVRMHYQDKLINLKHFGKNRPLSR